MTTIDQILDMWKVDCDININHLAGHSLETANLHSKYLRFLISMKQKLSALNIEYKTLRQLKFRYYRGEMTRQELAEHQWEQWMFAKPLKNEMEEFLSGDKDMIKITSRIEYINNGIQALESIMSQIKQRDWHIRNAIEHNKFIAGG